MTGSRRGCRVSEEGRGGPGASAARLWPGRSVDGSLALAPANTGGPEVLVFQAFSRGKRGGPGGGGGSVRLLGGGGAGLWRG